MIHAKIDDADLRAFGRALKALPRNEWPFATALSLTRTAAAAQTALRADLPDRFTVRRPWLLRQVKMEKATKRQPTPIARVFMSDATDYFAGLQERGGRKRGRRGGRVAIPTGATRNKRGTIPRGRRPATLLAKRGGPRAYFIGKMRDGTEGVFERRKSGAITLLYALEPVVQIKPALGLEQTVRETMKREFPMIFTRAIADIERQLAERARR
ncbi:MAG: hypothetical protein AAF360_06105 [Pseudomonadota bacterium]